MSINKIIVTLGVILAIFITFVFIQFNPANKKVATDKNNFSLVTIKDQTFSVTVAKTDSERQTGLSNRELLPLSEGMLFTFDKADTYAFWMKDMRFPIDIIFIKDNKIVSITENVEPPASLIKDPKCGINISCYTPTNPANKVLEINAGLSKKYNFKTGDRVTIKLK